MITLLALLLAIAGYLWLGVIGTGTELAFLWPGIFGFAAAGLVAAFAKTGERPASASPLCIGTAVAFVAYISWRALASDVAYFGRQDLLLALPALVFYGLFATVLGGTRARLALVAAMFVVLLGSVAVALYQKFGDELFSIIPGYERDIDGHFPSGFYNVHPHFAGFLEIAIPFAVALVLLGRLPLAARLASAAVAVVGLVGLVVSMSRGGFAGTFIGLSAVGVCWLAARSRGGGDTASQPSRWPMVAGFGVALVAVAALAAMTLNKRFAGGLVGEDGKINAGGRMAYWEAAMQQFGEAPVIGTGARSFGYHFNKYVPEDFWVGTLTPRHVHNEYLQVLAEYGLIGGALALLFVGSHLKRGIQFVGWCREKGRAGNDLALAAGAVGAVAAHVVHVFFDFDMHLLANASLMAFAFAVLAAPATRPTRPPSVGVFARGALPAISLVLVLLGLRYAPADNDLRLGERTYRAGDEATATAYMHKVKARDPDNFRAFKNLAVFRFTKTEDDLPNPLIASYAEKALDGFKEALILHPHDYFSMYHAGRCETLLAVFEGSPQAREKRFKQAERWLSKAAQWAPLRYEPATWQGELWRTRALAAQIGGDDASALEFARKAFERFEFAVRRTPMRLRGSTTQQLGKMEMKRLIATLERRVRPAR